MIGWIIASIAWLVAAEINWRNGRKFVASFYFVGAVVIAWVGTS